MTFRGFKSAPWKPYEVLGQPMKLNVKNLVLNGLNQENEDIVNTDKMSINMIMNKKSAVNVLAIVKKI